MVRRGDRKLIEIPTASGSRFELYDLRTDPAERSDRFAAEQLSAPVQELRALLEGWHAEMSRSRPAPQRTDPAAAEQDERTLRSLGYLE